MSSESSNPARAERVKMLIEAGIPLMVPAAQFRSLTSMGTTFFYDEINAGRLRAVKHGRETKVPIDELARYADSCPPFKEVAAA